MIQFAFAARRFRMLDTQVIQSCKEHCGNPRANRQTGYKGINAGSEMPKM